MTPASGERRTPVESVALDVEIARLARAFANPLRVRVLETLVHGERCVDEIRSRVAAPLTSVSSQLKVLREARVVDARRDGARIHYRLADDTVLAALIALRRVAEARSLEAQNLVREFLADSDDLDHVTGDRLFEMMRTSETMLIDVRPRDEYEAGHIAGAISVPLDELPNHVDRLAGGGRVVAYCRDAYCVLAPQAVRALRRFGVATERLDVGFAEWAANGRPTEVADPNHDRKEGGA